MRRSLLTILIVAALAAWIARTERAVGVPQPVAATPAPTAARAASKPARPEWIRTAHGWERRTVLAAATEPRTPSLEIHPGLIAAFQLTLSLLVLVAIPAKPTPARCPAKTLTPAACGLAAPQPTRRRKLVPVAPRLAR